MIEPGHPCVTMSGNAFSCFETDVNEVNVDAVDLGHEHGQRVQPRLDLAPVVVGAPVADHLLEFRELRALRPVIDGLLVRPARGGDAPAQIDELLFRNVDAEGADGVAGGRSGQLRREQARGARDGEAHRGHAQKPAAILVDDFGGAAMWSCHVSQFSLVSDGLR